jgi:hypothetical protein
MRRLLRDGPEATGRLDLHVWLTFPDLTILDMVLRPAIEANAGRSDDAGRPDHYVILGKSEALAPGFAYEPFLVGEAVLHQIGAVWDGNRMILDQLLRQRS